MESAAPFDLGEIRRDWIADWSGEDFYREVRAVRASLVDADRTCVICEADPRAFSRQFFAAVSLGLPVALANPRWGVVELKAFRGLLEQALAEPGAILIPTGGTTGGVKLAIHDWQSLRAGARATQDFLGGGPIHSSCVLPLHHVSGLMQLVRSFVSGGTIRFDESEVAGRCLSLVPTQLQRLMQQEACIEKLNTAAVIFVGGAAMPSRVREQARELRLPVVPVYGMTETAAMIAAVPNREFLEDASSGALPLGDARFAVETDGSIRIWSRSLFKGYFGRAALDLREGYLTSDTGTIDERGRLHLWGRTDALINTGGEKVDPSEVRAALLAMNGIEAAQVIGEPDEEWGEQVVAHVRLSQGSVLSEAAIVAALKQRLSPFKIPKQIRLAGGPPGTGDFQP